ncbi:hypothetical protein H6F67_18575 [Microcoleus sp. FACHB-1515]|uniref:hypothetical protein n=1 Tax=Cyanophyceae TaxID=3028117 RepID=UPI00168698B5|nr:hypothetical protein [Microcoleus sp. FACHB-1515]MBD2091852.1 hypothetical protein [Microcoleus sp. FACHB-1515]
MARNTQNSIQLLVDNADNSIASFIEEIDRVKSVLEKNYESETSEIPREKLFEDIERLIVVSEHIKAAENLLDKIDILQSEYEPLAEEMRARYADFLTAEDVEKIEELEACAKAPQEMLLAQGVMIHAFLNVEDAVEQANLLYTGLVKISEALEKYIKYFTPQARENARKIASSFLADSTYNPDNHPDQTEIKSCMIALRNTARAVLWQIDQYQQEEKYTVGAILDWMQTSSGWLGNDFDDCLDYVNQVRKE